MSGSGHRTARVIHAAIVLGPTLFALLAVWLRGGEQPMSMNPDERRLMLYVWMAAIVGATLGALNLWRTRVVPHIEAAERAGPRSASGALLPGLVLVWAVVESAALFGLVVYFVTGSIPLLVGSLAVVWINGFVTRPRPQWFGAGHPDDYAAASRYER